MWVAARQITQAGCSLILNLMLARHLGAGQYGLLSFCLSIVALVLPVAVFGLDKSLLRELVSQPQSALHLLRKAMTLRLLSGALAFVIAVGMFWALMERTRDVYLLGLPIALTLFVGAGSLLDYFFQSQQRFSVNFFAIAGGGTVAVAVAAVLIFYDAPLGVIVWLRSLETTVASLLFISFFLVLRKQQTSPAAMNTGVRELASRSWPFLLSSIAVVIYARVDQVMIGSLSTYQELGFYSAAVKLAEVWYMVPTFIIGAMMPSTLRLRDDEAELRERMTMLYETVAIIGVVALVFNVALAGRLVILIFGSEFSSAEGMLLVLSGTVFFAGVGGARTVHILARGHDRLYAITTVLGMLVNVILNLILIPRFGGVGAAWATLVAQFVAAYASCFLFAELRPDGVLMTKALFLPSRLFRRLLPSRLHRPSG